MITGKRLLPRPPRPPDPSLQRRHQACQAEATPIPPIPPPPAPSHTPLSRSAVCHFPLEPITLNDGKGPSMVVLVSERRSRLTAACLQSTTSLYGNHLSPMLYDGPPRPRRSQRSPQTPPLPRAGFFVFLYPFSSRFVGFTLSLPALSSSFLATHCQSWSHFFIKRAHFKTA